MCFYFAPQVQFKDDRQITNVNKKDLFLHLFDELMAPESDMFMYNERKTLAWFPPRVSPVNQRKPSTYKYVVSMKRNSN